MSAAPRLRINYFVNSQVVSGGETYALSVARALRDRGTVVRFVGRPGSAFLEVADHAGFEILTLDLPPKLGRRTIGHALRGGPAAIRSIRAFAASLHEQDAVILQYKLEQLLWPSVQNVTMVLEHGPIPPLLLRVPLVRRRLRRLYERSELFAVSEVAAQSMAAVTQRSVSVLPPVVDGGRMTAAVGRRDVTRASVMATGTTRLLVYAGRLAENKGVDLLPRLAAELGPGWTTVVVGEGTERERLVQEADALRLGDCFRAPGFLRDACDYIAAADVVVHPTRDPGEGRPLVVLEALACGTPVIGNVGSPSLVLLRREVGEPDTFSLVQMVHCDLVADEVRRLCELARSPLGLADWGAVAEQLEARLDARSA